MAQQPPRWQRCVQQRNARLDSSRFCTAIAALCGDATVQQAKTPHASNLRSLPVAQSWVHDYEQDRTHAVAALLSFLVQVSTRCQLLQSHTYMDIAAVEHLALQLCRLRSHQMFTFTDVECGAGLRQLIRGFRRGGGGGRSRQAESERAASRHGGAETLPPVHLAPMRSALL